MEMIYSILALKNEPAKLNSILTRMKGISGTVLYAVSYDEITAVVGNVDRIDLIADKSGAIEYAGVIEDLTQQFTLLPMRFGSVLESTCEIIKILERNYLEIQQNLRNVKNKFEFGLKVFCDSEKIKEELKAKTEPEIKAPVYHGQEIKNSVYRNYVNEKLKEHRLEELILNYADSVIKEITGYLDRLNAVSKFKKMATASIIVDAVFLIHKEKKDDLIKAVGDLQGNYPGLNFIMTGPWPPYNFVELTIK